MLVKEQGSGNSFCIYILLIKGQYPPCKAETIINLEIRKLNMINVKAYRPVLSNWQALNWMPKLKVPGPKEQNAPH